MVPFISLDKHLKTMLAADAADVPYGYLPESCPTSMSHPVLLYSQIRGSVCGFTTRRGETVVIESRMGSGPAPPSVRIISLSHLIS